MAPLVPPLAQRDFYQVLGIPRDASPADVRAAFIRLARQHHPDLHDSGIPWRLQEVQQAYHALSDTDARAEHDRALHESERLHFARQREVQRRLGRYDRRHPRPYPRAYRRLSWRSLLLVALGAAILAYLALVVID